YGRRRLSSKERIELFSTDEAVRVQRDVEHADYFAGAGVDEHLVLDGQRIQPGRHLPGQSRRLGGIGDELRFGDVETALGSRLNDADGAGCPNDRARIEIGYRIQVRLVAVDDHRRLTGAVETHLDPAAIYRDPGEGLTERDVPRVSAFHDPLDAQVLIRAPHTVLLGRPGDVAQRRGARAESRRHAIVDPVSRTPDAGLPVEAPLRQPVGRKIQ